MDELVTPIDLKWQQIGIYESGCQGKHRHFPRDDKANYSHSELSKID
jgi:hypothetical protein